MKRCKIFVMMCITAKPFLKWVGGKQQLLAQFEIFFPKSYKRYCEPFVGSGAVFFHLWSQHCLPSQSFLFDNNAELINVYQVVRDNVGALIELLSVHKARHNKEYYYKVRALDRQGEQLSSVEMAARTIYLNKTGYNGLYRVNRRGQFNVPMGRYTNPPILQEDVLRVASDALRDVAIEQVDFRQVVTLAQPGDFFYFDPPYDPLNSTANFTAYTAGSFNAQDQHALANVFRQLTDKGVRCMLSNSQTPLILNLYRNFRIETVQARRAVNSNANRRGRIPEVLVLNYT